MKKVLKVGSLFTIGGMIYLLVEIVWRSVRNGTPTHWTMFLLGGLCFVAIGAINEYLPWEAPFWLQAIIGTAIVLTLEFIFGYVLNILLGLNIWDYSNLPFNILGQICLPFAFAWILLSAIAIILDDYLRYWFFGEEKPHYHWHFKK